MQCRLIPKSLLIKSAPLSMTKIGIENSLKQSKKAVTGK